jgi:hypothetical protein
MNSTPAWDSAIAPGPRGLPTGAVVRSLPRRARQQRRVDGQVARLSVQVGDLGGGDVIQVG